MAELGQALPRHLRRVVTYLELGDLGANIEMQGIDRSLAEMRDTVNNFSVVILIGALTVGLSQFVHMVTPSGFIEQYAGRFFGLLLFAAIILGFWQLFSVVRPKRR